MVSQRIVRHDVCEQNRHKTRLPHALLDHLRLGPRDAELQLLVVLEPDALVLVEQGGLLADAGLYMYYCV